jgi:hypothetical protein
VQKQGDCINAVGSSVIQSKPSCVVTNRGQGIILSRLNVAMLAEQPQPRPHPPSIQARLFKLFTTSICAFIPGLVTQIKDSNQKLRQYSLYVANPAFFG